MLANRRARPFSFRIWFHEMTWSSFASVLGSKKEKGNRRIKLQGPSCSSFYQGFHLLQFSHSVLTIVHCRQ